MEGKMGKKVYELNLHGKKLTKMEGFEKYTTLRVLDLSCNEVTQIEGLNKNRDLRELKLYGNKIKLLNGLESLSVLCHLQLQHNYINKLGNGLCNLKKLQILRLDHNQLEVISSNEIAPFSSHMTHLDLSCNRLVAVEGFGAMMNLQELKLANNQLSDLPDLSRCKKLTEFDVSSNPLKPGALVKLKNRQLKILRVEHLHLADIVSSLPKLHQLEELHAAGNDLASTEELPAHFPWLEVLDLRQNRLESIDSLSPLSRVETLRELAVETNPLCSKSEKYRIDIREMLPCLELVDGVSSNVAVGIGVAGKMLPLMRPLTPSSVGPSLHQIERQLLEAEVQLENYTSGVTAKFEMMRSDPLPLKATLKTLTSHNLSSSEGEETDLIDGGSRETELGFDSNLTSSQQHDTNTPPSSTGKLNNGCSGTCICDVYTDVVRSSCDYEERGQVVRPSSSCSSRPSTRGSSRTRIEDALAFATENFGELEPTNLRQS